MSMEPSTPQKPKGRHRAVPPAHDPANVVPLDTFFPTEQLPIVSPRQPLTRRERREREAAERRNNRRKAATMATGSMLVVTAAGGSYGMYQAASPMKPRTSESQVIAAAAPQGSITADDVQIVFDQPKVTTEAAPPPPPPPPAPVRVEQAAPAPVAKAPAPAPAPLPPVPTTTKAAAIANAALAQVGRVQDCTMLVTNSLKAVGISFHDWPAGYFSLGPTVPYSQAVPGDLIWYDDGGSASLPGWDHIAVYIGNGKAVHGGFNGNQTVIFSMNVGSGPGAFIRVA